MLICFMLDFVRFCLPIFYFFKFFSTFCDVFVGLCPDFLNGFYWLNLEDVFTRISLTFCYVFC